MDRRTFIKTTMAAAGAVQIGARGLFAARPASIAARAASRHPGDNRVLVVVRLDGGNDGLNTVVPLDRMDALARARSNILIPASRLLALEPHCALHPAMEGFQKLYKDGDLRIVQSVGYPNHNQSHFRSTDIWFSGSDSNQVLESGVLGRYLETRFPDYPVGYPRADQPHPPSIQIGSTLLTLLQGRDTGMGMAISDPTRVYALQSDAIDEVPDTPWGHELTFLRQMASQTRQYGDAIKTAMSKAANRSSLYPATGNRLSDQLKSVARLIAGGMETQVYVVSMGGFDTHSAQVQSTDAAAGAHADLLRQLSVAVTAFLDDLALLGVADRVVGLTMSEFGRRIVSNASLGTDHGTAAPLFLFGKPVKGGISGTSPVIPDLATSRDNVPMQFDFRSIYASLLDEWLLLDPAEVASILGRDHPRIPLLESGYGIHPPRTVLFDLETPLADPGNRGGVVSFSVEEASDVRIAIHDLTGHEVQVVVSDRRSAGRHTVRFSTARLGSGHYLMGMRVAGGTTTKAFHLLH